MSKPTKSVPYHMQNIATRKSQILYRKVGKKYVPATDPWAINGLRDGWHLVKVDGGCTSIREIIYPDKAPLYAAARDLEDKLIAIIRNASEARPNKTPLTLREKRDWDEFIKAHGESFNTLHYPSFAANAEAIVKVLMGKADE